MATELATAYVSLAVSGKGLRKGIDKAVGASSAGLEKQGRGLGSRLASGMGRALRVGATAGAVAAGAAVGAAMVGGFRSAVDQENAEKALSGLYGSAGAASDMMDRLRKVSKGSPIELSAYAAGAKSLAYMGLEGKQAAGVLENVGAAVIAAGGGTEEMGRATDALLKMENAGVVQLDTLNQLSEAGVPIFSGLAEHFGTNIANVREMVTDGKVGMEDVLSVTENATGKTFKSMKRASDEVSKSFGNQWKIAKDNVMVAIGQNMRPALERLTPLIGKAGAGLTGFINGFGSGTGAGGRFRDVLVGIGSAARTGLGAAFSAVGPVVSRVFEFLAPHVRTFADAMRGLVPQAVDLAKAVGSFLVAAFRAAQPYLVTAAQIIGAVLVGALKALPPVLSLAMAQFKNLLGFMRPLLPLIAGVAAGFAVYRGVMFAAGVATRVWMAVTKIATVVMRLFNAAMRANPIGLVITGIMLLVGALVYLYKNNDTARRIMQAAWKGIKAAAMAVVNWFRKTAWPVLRGIFQGIARTAKWLWQKGIKPAFNGIRAVIAWWYKNVVKRYFALVSAVFRGAARVAKWLWRKGIQPAFRGIAAVGKWLWARLKQYFALVSAIFRGAGRVAKWLWRNGIRPAFQGIAKLGSWLWGRLKASFAFMRRGFQGVQRIAMWLWNKGIKPAFRYIADRAKWLWGKVKWAFDKMKSGMTALKDRFATVRDQIGTIWSKLKGKITGPVKSAIKWLQRNFVGKLNTWMGKIPGIPAKGILGKIPMPRGWASGGYTGKGSKYAPAGIVHRDEFVIKKSSRRKFEQENPGALDHLNRTGKLPGYRIGGKVAGLDKRFYRQLAAFNKAAGGRYRVNSGYRSNAKQAGLYARYLAGRGPVAARPGSSMHNKGLAADLAPSDARNRHGNAFARRFGLVYTVPSESWHIEPTWARSGKSGANGFVKGLKGMAGFIPGSGLVDDLPEWARHPVRYVKNKFKGLTDKFKAGKYGLAGHVMPAVFKKAKAAVTTKFKDAAEKYSMGFLGGGGGNMDWSNIKSGPNKVMGKEMAKRYGWTGGQWSALRTLWEKESNWNHRAKNPSSGAYGIPQSLPASKMANRSQGGGPDYRTNPRTQISWGLKYIKGRYGSPGAALSFHHRKNWYADGGRVTPPVFDNGGTLAPGMNLVHNKLGRPEPLVRQDQPVQMRITSGALSFDDKGRAYLEGVATAVYEDNERHAGTRARMGAGRRF